MPTRFILIIAGAILIGGAVFYFLLKEDTARSERMTAQPVKIVAFGDSLTAGYGVDARENYPYLLESSLIDSYNVTVINQGVHGDTTADARLRADTILNDQPDIVILGIGGNDALRLLPADKARENIGTIIEILQGAQKPPRILLLQMQAGIHGGFEYKKQFDRIYPELAEKYGVPLVPFIVTKIYLDEAYMLPDRIHMNKEGYAYIVREHLRDAVEKEIRKLQ